MPASVNRKQDSNLICISLGIPHPVCSSFPSAMGRSLMPKAHQQILGLFPFRDRAWSFRPQTSGHFAGLSACLADTTSPCFLGGPKPSQRCMSPAGAVLRIDLASSCLLLSLQVKVTVLADNDPSSAFHYLIQVYTGYRRRAATTAKVSRAHAHDCVSSAKCVFSIL